MAGDTHYSFNFMIKLRGLCINSGFVVGDTSLHFEQLRKANIVCKLFKFHQK